MTIAISQPTFLPWCGYIALIDHVSEFIFLDNVQFDKRSWQQRNSIKTNDSKITITVPVHSKNLFNQKINEVEINYSEKFLLKMIKTIEQSYSKSEYFKNYSKEMFEILMGKQKRLIDLNILLIKWVCEKMNINCTFSLSSELDINSSKSDLIVEICKKKKASRYISTIGAESYLDKEIFLQESNCELFFFDYLNKDYKQIHGKFISKLSVIDLLFNNGPKSKQILRENFILR